MRLYDEANTGASLRARQLRRNSTEAEKRLLRGLRTAFPGRKWRHQMPVGPYFADKLIIEVDGGQHATAVRSDDIRAGFLKRRGFRVIRFWNNDVLENLEGVLAAIAEALSSSPFRRSAPPSLSHGRGMSDEVARG